MAQALLETPRSMTGTRVLVVDDHRTFAELLTGALASAGMRPVGIAQSAAQAILMTQELQPDVVVMDLDMPRVDGIEATRKILARQQTNVLVLTAFSDRARILGALEAGACGYLLKDAASEDVAEGIRAAARGESPLDPRAARTVLSARSEPDPLAGLSQREREVLDALVEGLPNKLIARRLGISEKTVKTHLTSVFRAIDVTDRTQAALWAERHGLGGS